MRIVYQMLLLGIVLLMPSACGAGTDPTLRDVESGNVLPVMLGEDDWSRHLMGGFAYMSCRDPGVECYPFDVGCKSLLAAVDNDSELLSSGPMVPFCKHLEGIRDKKEKGYWTAEKEIPYPCNIIVHSAQQAVLNAEGGKPEGDLEELALNCLLKGNDLFRPRRKVMQHNPVNCSDDRVKCWPFKVSCESVLKKKFGPKPHMQSSLGGMLADHQKCPDGGEWNEDTGPPGAGKPPYGNDVDPKLPATWECMRMFARFCKEQDFLWQNKISTAYTDIWDMMRPRVPRSCLLILQDAREARDTPGSKSKDDIEALEDLALNCIQKGDLLFREGGEYVDLDTGLKMRDGGLR